MLLVLYFIPLDEIANMSLNGLRRQVAIHDKTQTETQMDKLSIALDLGMGFQLVNPLHCHSIAWKGVCQSIFKTRVFLKEA
jgi:hypothetical protein